MGYRPRIYYTEAQKALMWDRWQKGDSLETIARLFERGHSSVQRILQVAGGIRPAQSKTLETMSRSSAAIGGDRPARETFSVLNEGFLISTD